MEPHGASKVDSFSNLQDGKPHAHDHSGKGDDSVDAHQMKLAGMKKILADLTNQKEHLEKEAERLSKIEDIKDEKEQIEMFIQILEEQEKEAIAFNEELKKEHLSIDHDCKLEEQKHWERKRSKNQIAMQEQETKNKQIRRDVYDPSLIF